MSYPIIDRDIVTETHDIFQVTQLTRDTELQSEVAADRVVVEPGQASQIHRHNHAETVLYILAGSGVIVVDDVDHPVVEGDRIRVGKGVFHGVRTGEADTLTFLSVQRPPILDEATGVLDLEPR
jgi:mannose-6-phosphate isomerase-like protein (cupin superfamily)